MPIDSIVITGATSQVGHFLLPKLARAGLRVAALSRKTPPVTDRPHVSWLRTSSSDWMSTLQRSGPHHAAIHLAPLPLLPALLPAFREAGVVRVVAFGTTGRFYKTGSGDAAEQAYILSVVAAETEIADRCRSLGIEWTLFRPTLVYGCGMDRNIMFIAAFVRRFGFFPLFAGGRGLRQPVHADDLAEACVKVLECPATYGRAYNVSGGSVLTFREMVEAVFRQLGRPTRLLPVSLPLFRLALAVAKRVPRFSTLSTEMATRQSMDMCFDHDEATRDFGFSPRPFHLDRIALGDGRDLPG